MKNQTLHSGFLATRIQRLAKSPTGFSLLEVIGVLAVMATVMAVILPNLIQHFDRLAREQEGHNLRAIAGGIETYLRESLDMPNDLNQLSPEYVPFADAQIQNNYRGFARYLDFHPNLTPFNNGNGVAPSNLEYLRYLLITDLRQNVNPNINNATQFTTWWNTDETPTPDLLIYRGTIKSLFRLVSLSAIGTGGSYRIGGNSQNSGNGKLATYGQYHLAGTLVELSENKTFSGGSGVTISFTLVEDVGFQWDPNCPAGSKWHVLGASC